MSDAPTGKIDAILAERGAIYGSFKDCAAISCGIKDVFRAAPNWNKLTAEQQEVLDQMATKCSRILSGDPDHVDNWVDIAGAATLGAKSIKVSA